jgi:predicted Zn finger-like uncharacterized protein
MDVTCDRCKAEYEFDEALLGEKGTTVKCSACGHVFRVMPPDREVGRAQLRLRYAKDGSVQNLGSLRELQQRIRAGEVSLDDELGRDGFAFRALRDVPELKNFFARSPEKTTVKPDPQAMATAPTEAVRTAPARAPFDDSPVTAKMKPEMLLGALPTARKTPVPRNEPKVAQAPTARVPAEPWPDPRLHRGEPKIPAAARTHRASVPPAIDPPSAEAIAKAAVKQPHRTMLGVGPSRPAEAAPERHAAGGARGQAASGTLGPPAAMTAGHAEAADARARESARGTAPPHAPTLLGGPQARDFGLNGGPVPSGPAFPSGQTAAPAGPPSSSFDHAPTLAAPAASAAARFPISEPGRAIDPGALPRFPISDAARTVEPSGSVGPAPVRLYVDDDDAPPGRSRGGSSKTIWIVLGLLVLGGAGWVGMNVVRQQSAHEPAPAVAPEPASATAPTTGEDAAVAAAPLDPAVRPAAQEAEPAADKPATDKSAGDPPSGDQDEADKKEAEAKGQPAQPAAEERGDKPDERERKSERAEPEKSTRERSSDRSSDRRGGAEPQDYGEWVTRGDQLSSRGDQDGAAKAYRSALALRPAGSEANSGLGFALLAQGQARDALPYFDRAASSGYAEANVGLGDAYRKLGQNSSAVEAYKEYLERLPTGSRVSYVRGWLDKLDKGERSGAAPTQDNGYRPAGELNEPSGPSAPANAPAPEGPSEPPK